jgi:phenylacetate-CoA ligase
MAIEDLLHPLLGAYIDSPQWVKATVGRAYAMLPVALRRGRHYQGFLDEASLRDPQQIAQLVSAKLATTLRWAFDTVPHYQQYRHLGSQLAGGLDAPLAVLRQLPMITKQDIKHDLDSFLSTRVPAAKRLLTFTGGSTASAMRFFLQKGVTRTKEYAFMEDFHQRVGLTADDLVLAMRGRSVPTARHPGGRLWMLEPIKRQLILSSDHLLRDNMAEYVEAMRQCKPRYIQAFPSAIYPLARWLKENPAPDVVSLIKGIMLFSENVYDHQTQLLEEVFACPVLKHYGHSERLLMSASMPGDKRCFFWPQYGQFELVDERGNVITQPGVLGEIVGTGFDNQVMPFIRYRTGDMAVLSDKPHPLLPGYPVVERIEGRLQEFIVCNDDRLISICTMGAAHFGDLAQVEAIQYEQKERGHFLLKLAVTQPLSAAMRERIVQAVIAKTQGGCTAEVVEVSEIARTGRGKHQMLVQHLDIGAYFGASAA